MDVDLIQRSPEWRAARCGSIGSSEVPDIVRHTKKGVSATREAKLKAKVLERLTGFPEVTYESEPMRIGKLREPLARAAYELIYEPVTEIGLTRHPTIERAHSSPDGLVGEVGLLEIKCPQRLAHLETLRWEKIEADYLVQIVWHLACHPDREWCDYVSYSPDFSPEFQFWCKRVERDDDVAVAIEELEEMVVTFDADVEAALRGLRERYAA